ncbi:MAG TPA: formylmethanofuran dehydrogenase [Deltaproteobacteria bacterium]|nr:formylmethanofuran dehydrogenase [Deltaproteobacteria bacterium]
MTNPDEPWEDGFQRCVDFHGHACPGLAMGYVAAKAAMAWLGENRAEDEEIVAIVETDACGADAVQVVTGCTFGKGNFLFKDYGKTAFTVLSRAKGKGIRLYARPNAFPRSTEYYVLSERVSSGEADEKDLENFMNLHRQRTLDVLTMAPGEIFEFKEVTVPLPPRARVLDSHPCNRCGEWAMASRLVTTNQGLLCASCATELQ